MSYFINVSFINGIRKINQRIEKRKNNRNINIIVLVVS